MAMNRHRFSGSNQPKSVTNPHRQNDHSPPRPAPNTPPPKARMMASLLHGTIVRSLRAGPARPGRLFRAGPVGMPHSKEIRHAVAQTPYPDYMAALNRAMMSLTLPLRGLQPALPSKRACLAIGSRSDSLTPRAARLLGMPTSADRRSMAVMAFSAASIMPRPSMFSPRATAMSANLPGLTMRFQRSTWGRRMALAMP